MGTKQPEEAIIGCRYRLSAGGRQAKECINLPHGLLFGRLWSHTSSECAAPDAKSDTNLYDPVVLGSERARGYNSGWRRTVVDAAVRELSGNIRDTNSWEGIFGVFGGTPLSGDAASKIDDVLAGANLRDLFKADPESCRSILKAASVRIQYL